MGFDSINQPTDAQMNSAAYDHRGSSVDFERQVAIDLGLAADARSSYQASLRDTESRFASFTTDTSYTDGDLVDIVRIGDRLLNNSDVIDVSSRADGAALLAFGLTGSDTLKGGDGKDWLYGGTGDDILFGGAGDDQIWGGDKDSEGLADGTDIADYSDDIGGIGINLDSGGEGPALSLYDGGGGFDVLHSIEHIIGSDDSYFQVIGTIPTDCALTVDGGPSGNMSVHAGMATSGVIVEIDAQGDGGLSSIDGGTVNLEDVTGSITGSAYDDILTFAAGAARLYGDAGNDMITGGDGEDILHSGDGADALHGGAGHDLLIGEDWIGVGHKLLDAGAGNDHLRLEGYLETVTLKGGAGNDLYDFGWIYSGEMTLEIRPGGGHDEVRSEDSFASSILTIDFTTWAIDDVRIVWNATVVEEIYPDYYKMRGDLAFVVKSTGESLLFRDVEGNRSGAPGGVVREGATENGWVADLQLPRVIFSDVELFIGDGTSFIDIAFGDTAPFDQQAGSGAPGAQGQLFGGATQVEYANDFVGRLFSTGSDREEWNDVSGSYSPWQHGTTVIDLVGHWSA